MDYVNYIGSVDCGRQTGYGLRRGLVARWTGCEEDHRLRIALVESRNQHIRYAVGSPVWGFRGEL